MLFWISSQLDILLTSTVKVTQTSRTNFPTEQNVGFITALHWMQGGLVTRKLSVRLTVCLSVWQRRGLWQNGRKISSDFYSIRKITILVFWEEERFVGANPSAWNVGSNWPRWSEIADFQSIFTRSASAVAPSKKFNLCLIIFISYVRPVRDWSMVEAACCQSAETYERAATERRRRTVT